MTTDPRAPLPAAALRRELSRPGGLWRALEVVESTGSTNADAAAAARAGAEEGLVVVAEHQSAGRGRAGRGWASPPRAGLAVSLLLRPPPAAAAQLGWLPLLAGVVLTEVAADPAGVAAVLKWPNDLLAAGTAKCAGVLAEVAAGAVVLGIGLNVTTTAAELPPDTAATSLALAGARSTDRGELLRSLLERTEHWYACWRAAGGDAGRCGLWTAYRQRCATLGAPVRVLLPDGAALSGIAEDVDAAGRLVVTGPEGQQRLAAGDVTHLRHATADSRVDSRG